MNSRTARWAFALVIIAVGFAAYSNTFNAPFEWDSETFIRENPLIQNLDNFVHPAEARHHPYFYKMVTRYVTYLTFALNYRVNGFSYPGWHLVNILIHITTALLFFALVQALFKTPALKDSRLSGSSQTIAFFCALYFVAHPMQTMAVTYIYQRLASMVTLFYLASALAYIRYRIAETTRGKYLAYGACLVCAAIAMKTKENSITLPIVITAMELMFFSGPLKRRLLPVAPVFMVIAVIPISMLMLKDKSGTLAVLPDGINNVSDYAQYSTGYLFTQFKTLVKYLRLYAFPVGQSLMHDSPEVKSFFELGVITSFALLCSLAGTAIWLFARERKRRPETVLISFGIAWFFITHSVESSMFYLPIAVQEYRAYLPSVGMFLSAVTFAVMTVSKLSHRTARGAALCAIFAVAVIFAFVTHERNKVWATPKSLWQDVVLKAPMTPSGYVNLARVHTEMGEPEKAVPLYLKAIELEPDSVKAHTNLGGILMALGELDEAAEHFRTAIEIDPTFEGPHSNLGAIHSAKGEYELALKYLNESVKLHPDYASGWYNLGLLYHKTNSLDNAVECYQKALALDGNLGDAQSNLGAVYLATGDYDRAIEHLAEAVRLAPSDSEVHYDLAYAFYEANRFSEARAEARRSLSLDPNNRRARSLLLFLSRQ